MASNREWTGKPRMIVSSKLKMSRQSMSSTLSTPRRAETFRSKQSYQILSCRCWKRSRQRSSSCRLTSTSSLKRKISRRRHQSRTHRGRTTLSFNLTVTSPRRLEVRATIVLSTRQLLVAATIPSRNMIQPGKSYSQRKSKLPTRQSRHNSSRWTSICSSFTKSQLENSKRWISNNSPLKR